MQQSKFYAQLHILLLDGIALGGFNIVDLPYLNDVLQLPCLSVMRKQPDFDAIDQALQHFSDYDIRRKLVANAGRVYEQAGFVFQVAGCNVNTAADALAKLTDTGKVPEALRLAHLIGAAVKTGESSNRA